MLHLINVKPKNNSRDSKDKGHQPARRNHYTVQACAHARTHVCTVPYVRSALIGTHVLCITYILAVYTYLVYTVGPQK